jgi:hypothetical protein
LSEDLLFLLPASFEELLPARLVHPSEQLAPRARGAGWLTVRLEAEPGRLSQRMKNRVPKRPILGHYRTI